MSPRWLLAGLLAITSCAPKQIAIQVSIITESCDAKVDPFAGVNFLRLRVTGDNLSAPIDSVAPTGGMTRELKIPEIPAGKNRVIDVRGYDADPATGGKVLSVGKSLPFEVADVIPDPSDNKPIVVTVFLRKVNAFTPPSAAGSVKDCQKMKVPRAGHTATVLKNGKVFVAGGYNFIQASASRVSLSDTELYNPTTNAFEASPRMAISNGSIWIPKAFHTATLLKSGQVLLWGGETYTGGVNNYPAPAAIILVYDADENAYGAVKTRTDPAAIARTRHQAAIDVNGKVLIVGGETRVLSPPAKLVAADKAESFDPSTNLYQVVAGASLPRIDAAAIAVRAGQFIAVAGGTNGSLMEKEVVFFKWDTASSTFRREVTSPVPSLADPGRRAAALATLRDGVDLLVLGGYSDPLARVPIASSEIVATSTSTVSMGPTIGSSAGRGELCAVQLPDGKVIAIGGLTIDMAGAPEHSDGSTVIISPNSAGGATGIGGPALSIPRYQHTCTALPDGTVLVLGGVNEQPSGKEILQDAWIYQPAPTDP